MPRSVALFTGQWADLPSKTVAKKTSSRAFDDLVLVCRGDGNAGGVHQRSAEEVKKTARDAQLLGADVVNGFRGSPVWTKLWFFTPTRQEDIEVVYKDFTERWSPLLDALKKHSSFGFKFDPSHLICQMINPAAFIEELPKHIFNCHVKDSKQQITGRTGIHGSRIDFGDSRCG